MKILCKNYVCVQGGGMVKPGSILKLTHLAKPQQFLYIMVMNLEILKYCIHFCSVIFPKRK